MRVAEIITNIRVKLSRPTKCLKSTAKDQKYYIQVTKEQGRGNLRNLIYKRKEGRRREKKGKSYNMTKIQMTW